MNHNLPKIALLVLCFSSSFGQTKWLAEWGTELTIPKYSIYSIGQQYIYLAEFGSFFLEEPKRKKFTLKSDLSAFLRIRKDRYMFRASVGMFNERFNLSNGSSFINNKSYFLSGERNGLRAGLATGYRIYDRTALHLYLSLGSSYDLLVYKADYNPMNIIISSFDRKSSNDVLIYQNYFLDRDFTLPKVGLTGSLDAVLYGNTFSLAYDYRNPMLNPTQSGSPLFRAASVIKLQCLFILGYKMK